MQVHSILILERRVTLAEVGLGFPALQSNTAVSAKPKQLPIRNKVTVNTSCNACHEGQVILVRTHLSSPILTKPHNYSELFHMPYLDAWALPWSALLEWVQWCCTNLFHAFSPDQLNGSVTQLNRNSLRSLFTAIVYSRSWVRNSVNYYQNPNNLRTRVTVNT